MVNLVKNNLPNVAGVRLALDFLEMAEVQKAKGDLNGWASCLRLAGSLATEEAYPGLTTITIHKDNVSAASRL